MSRIKQYRKLLGLSQQQLAELSEVTQAAISQYESSDRVPKTESLLKIAAALNVSPLELIDSPGSPPPSLPEHYDRDAFGRVAAIVEWYLANKEFILRIEAAGLKMGAVNSMAIAADLIEAAGG